MLGWGNRAYSPPACSRVSLCLTSWMAVVRGTVVMQAALQGDIAGGASRERNRAGGQAPSEPSDSRAFRFLSGLHMGWDGIQIWPGGLRAENAVCVSRRGCGSWGLAAVRDLYLVGSLNFKCVYGGASSSIGLGSRLTSSP